jgi:tRNA threonylcarbamoyladenosine biosynthesis protein TsaB
MENTYLLAIETATSICSVALAKNGKVIALRESIDAYAHSKVLTVFIEELVEEAGIEKKELSGIIVSDGPGSYTGLRIGISVAKGLAYALDIPIVTVPTLVGIATGMHQMLEEQDIQNYIFRPMIDARRMEVYSMELDPKLQITEKTKAIVLDPNFFSKYISKVVVASDKIEKIQELTLGMENVIILDKFQISAIDLLAEGTRKFKNKEFEDIAYFTPFYLKEFIAGIPRVKGLR